MSTLDQSQNNKTEHHRGTVTSDSLQAMSLFRRLMTVHPSTVDQPAKLTDSGRHI